MNSKIKMTLLGSTGSIGMNCLNCIDNTGDMFELLGLSTHVNVQLLMEQAKKYRPQYVAVTGRELSSSERLLLDSMNIICFTGENALVQLVTTSGPDLLVNAVVGASGFLPTLAAIENGVDIALANKETLVIGGEIVMKKMKKAGKRLRPIDSEHSALFQCLLGEDHATIEEIILTASGGPFRDTPEKEFKNIKVEQALKHPNWEMGKKITIDSATMMNKGLEVIEAFWLFDVPVEKIKVVIHPQSIIHSMVSFVDGSIKAQMGVPDMRIAIQFALTYPKRLPSFFPRLDFNSLKRLTFDIPNLKFRCLSLAYDALKTGGTAPAVLNAANEVAVSFFLNKRIHFNQISDIIYEALCHHNVQKNPEKEDLLYADSWARDYVHSQIDLL